MYTYKIKSNAKINLALNIIGKSKKLHKIESLISFIDLHDLIYLKKTKKKITKLFLQASSLRILTKLIQFIPY